MAVEEVIAGDEVPSHAGSISASSSGTEVVNGADGMAAPIRERELELQLQAEIPRQNGCELRVKDLTYEVRRQAGTLSEPTVGDMVMKSASLLTCWPILNMIAHGRAKSKTRTVVRGVSGVFKPGEMTLVIGPPGCGKSSLLKLLAGQIKSDKAHRISGQVLYNGQEAHTDKNAPFSLPKVAAYVQQTDRHVAHLTVEETITFAFDCMEGGTHGAWLAKGERTQEQHELLKYMDERKRKVRAIMTILGLNNAKDTIVGDVFTRGISGGERRRTTTGEMLAGSQDIFLMDSISNGLDSSTTFDILNTLKTASHIFKTTIIVALLQPQPEVYALFDKVVVMASGGRVVYQGKREGVLPYFRSIGYECPQRKDEADFVVEVTTDQGADYLVKGLEEEGKGMGSGMLPRTPREFEEVWRASEGFKELQQELAAPVDESYKGVHHHRHDRGRHHGPRHGRSSCTVLLLITHLFLSSLAGSIFFDLPLDATSSKFGLLFFSLLFLGLKGIAQIPVAIENRHVFYKQQSQGFYPTLCDVVAQEATHSTLIIAETLVFSPVIYFMTGLASDAGRFFIYLVIALGFNLNMAAYFRALAAIMPSLTVASASATLSLVFIILFCGYLVPEPDTPDVFIWIFWCNPMTWAFRSLVLNEFLAPKYKETCATDVAPGEACPASLSSAVLDSFGFRTDTAYIWAGFVYVAGLWFLTTCATALVLDKIRWDTSDAAPLLEDEQLEASDSDADESRWARRYTSDAIYTRQEVEASMARLKSDGTAAAAGAFTPVTLAFKDVRYSVPHPSGEGSLELLKNVSGHAKPGTMTALMGSSGAGKTTLLDVLASRKSGGDITGLVTLNGHPKDKKSFTRVAGYVEQNDVHSPVVTVREAVMFSATMRLEEADFPPDKRTELVDAILKILELDVISGRLIGSEATGGLSGEERKRVTIAVELASNPSLIFLDEPTTGLDARSAQVVVRAIRKVATTGRTIVCTIHQPSTYLFEMFDLMLLLKKGGETVYFGELGTHSSALISHLSSIPGTRPIANNANPATWMLEQIGAGTSTSANPQAYADWYSNSQLKRNLDTELDALQTPEPGSRPLAFDTLYAASAGLQRTTLVKRAYRQYWRSASYNFARMFAAVIQALVFASTFVNSEPTTVGQLTSRFGVVFSITTFIAITFFNTAIPFTGAERSVFYREQAARMYHVQPYILGYFLAEIPYLIFNTLLCISIFYWMANFEADAAKFFWFWLFFFLNTTAMTFFGHGLTAILPSIKDAQALASVSNSLFAVFGGFFISPGQIPNYWIWAYYITPFHYAIEGILSSQYHDDDTEIIALDGVSTTTISAYLDEFFGGKFSYSSRGYDVMALLIFIVIFQGLFFYALTYVRHEKR
ncbi:ABC-2 type transporter-domain-containing protein [Tribonema minus]|uniref:ABC-2 type transporter-domain-containing protein n=1 Tax=Tribonema minus TaxID=303371 RepID=A0A835Z0F1_9STRA|nr:ABC-2 type transporter-domain-containing protein [Tribonema minus]